MLAYRHAFHAGNHADVLKHLVLVQVLQHLNLKEKPYRLVDTHAGTGGYSLTDAEAQKKGEYRDGIGRLWDRKDLPAPVAGYVDLVRRFNPDGRLRHYPGSPTLAHALLRPDDQLRLFELHPTDHRTLELGFRGQRNVQVVRADGFAGLKSQLPPPSRRGAVLVDPSYEGHDDCRKVVTTLRDALVRFAEGVYLICRAPIKAAADRGLTVFSLELMPRITRAQSMDVLSSMATVAGYKAVLLAAEYLPRMFPMLVTAAGTVAPARVFVIGAGVAGLQAIATAKRLGAKVEAYDVRPAVKEQVQSLGAKFVELDLATGQAEDAGGYAKAMDESFYQRQRELLGEVVARNDVVIATEAVPDKKPPLLVTVHTCSTEIFLVYGTESALTMSISTIRVFLMN